MKIYNKPFFCYSKKLKEELDAQGIRYITRGIHEKSKRPYWVYASTSDLNEYLEQRRAKFE